MSTTDAQTEQPAICLKIRHPTVGAARAHMLRLADYHRRFGDKRRPGDPLCYYHCNVCSTPENPVYHGHRRTKGTSS